jgi:hypothetical protein
MSDGRTPDVVDAARFLAMSRTEAMRELGISEVTYARVYRDVEQAVATRDNREGQLGVHASIVIKRPGAKVSDVG